jgi:hypothetical protein
MVSVDCVFGWVGGGRVAVLVVVAGDRLFDKQPVKHKGAGACSDGGC